MFNYSYFFKIMEYDEKVLPKDIRKMGYKDRINTLVKDKDIIYIIDEVFFIDIMDDEVKAEIKADISKILQAIKYNEKEKDIILFDISRFSFVFKIGNKVLKIGFPKIVYPIPNLNIIIDSIIRKQYRQSNGEPILYIEVQERKENNLTLIYNKEEIEDILYKVWKEFRENGIIWYDPKEKNLVLNYASKDLVLWNSKYYNESSDEEKGIYKLKKYNFNKKELSKLLVVDTDLFLPVTIFNDLIEMFTNNPNFPGANNWKFKRVIEYEKRYLEECSSGTK